MQLDTLERKEIEKFIVGVLFTKPWYRDQFFFHCDKDFSYPEYRKIAELVLDAPEDQNHNMLSYLLGKGCLASTLCLFVADQDYIACPPKSFVEIADQLRNKMLTYELSKITKIAKTPSEIIAYGNELANLERIYKVQNVTQIMSKFYDNYIEKQDMLANGKSVFIDTGLKKFDYQVNMVHSELMILGARTSIGKTMFALWLAYNAARKGHKVLYINLEMGETQIMNRVVAMANAKGINEYRFYKADINDAVEAVEKIGNNFLIENGSGMNTDQIRSLIMGKEKIDIVFIDYINLLSDKAVSEQVRLTSIANKLKNYAKERNCVIVGLCQLNRDSEKQNRTPELYDIKDSSGIEQAADTVVLLHKKDRKSSFLSAYVKKQRQGMESELLYEFSPKSTSFYELTPETI